jgi:hypothetical protein
VNLDPGVPPGRNVAVRVAHPHSTYAKTRDEGDLPIDSDHLAVITADPAQRTVEPWWVKAAYFGSRLF